MTSTAILKTWPNYVGGKLQFSSDGKKLVIQGDTTTVVNIETGNRLVSFVNAIDYALSSDGTIIAYTANESPKSIGLIRLWDIERGIQLNPLVGHKSSVDSLAFNNDNNTLVSTGQDGTVRLWDVETRSQVALWQGYDATISCGCNRFVNYQVSFSPNNQWLLMFSGREQDHGLWLWDAKMQTKPVYLDMFAEFQAEHSFMGGVNHSFSADSSMFATIHGDTLYLRDTGTNSVRAELNNPQDNISMVFKFSPDTRWFGATPRKNTMVVWDVSSGREHVRFTSKAKEITSFDFSSDGTMAALGTSESAVELWDLRSGNMVGTIVDNRHSTDPTRANYVEFTPDGSAVVVQWKADVIELIDLKTGKPRISFPPEARVPIAFNHAGTQVALLVWDSGINIWNIATGESVGKLPDERKILYAITFSPDDKLLATGNFEGEVNLWDLGNGKRYWFKDLPRDAYAIAFSPDSKLLATVSGDDRRSSIRVWDLATLKSLIQFQSHSSAAAYLAFRENGKTLLAAGFDGGIREWAVEPRR